MISPKDLAEYCRVMREGGAQRVRMGDVEIELSPLMVATIDTNNAATLPASSPDEDAETHAARVRVARREQENRELFGEGA